MFVAFFFLMECEGAQDRASRKDKNMYTSTQVEVYISGLPKESRIGARL